MIAAWILSIPWREIQKVSKKFDINPKIIASIVMQESGGDACATRYENHYRWLLNPEVYAVKNRITVETETMQQKTSWGLMQIMGGVARELGYEGPLVGLCRPEINLHYGIKKLLQLKGKYSENLNDVFAAYNAGSVRKDDSGAYVNNHYVTGVNSYLRQL